jgi:hypothetical protein
MYISVPVLLYYGERTLRAFRAGNYTVNIVKAAIYRNVLALHMSKPAGFEYKRGMYLFLQCPEISPFEWHPFSITSAPDDEHISVHIRTVGDLNYPSFSVVFKSRNLVRVARRSVIDVGGASSVYEMAVESPPNINIIVEPRTLTFKKEK